MSRFRDRILCWTVRVWIAGGRGCERGLLRGAQQPAKHGLLRGGVMQVFGTCRGIRRSQEKIHQQDLELEALMAEFPDNVEAWFCLSSVGASNALQLQTVQ